MTKEQHRKRHKLLHKYLDELAADWIEHTKKMPSKGTIMELLEWSHKQTIEPVAKMEGR